MLQDDPRLIRLARSIADGEAGADTDPGFVPEDGATRAVLQGLREIASLAGFHRTWRSLGHASMRSPRPAPRAPVAPAAPDDAVLPAVPARDSSFEPGLAATSAPLGCWAHLELLEKIGEGVFGEVYRARETTLDREVALKLLRLRPEAVAREGTVAAHVLQEGRNMARVRHPNVVTVYGAEEHAERVGVWMEYIRGRTLEACLREQGAFGAQEAALVGVDLCRALTAVHQVGLVHRDVKATNVMRESGGRIVLMDFGAGADLLAGAPAARGLAGTPVYLAPEVLAGQPASVRADIYSLGVLLFHLVTTRFPLERDSLDALRQGHERHESLLLREVRPDLPPAFVQVVERALSADPEVRYATAGQMEHALAAALSLESADMRASLAQARLPRRLGRPFALAAVLLVLAAGATAVILRGRSGSARTSLRVAVAPFANETRDSSLDALGGMAADWISQGLSQVGFVDVVPLAMVAQAQRGSGTDARRGRDLVQALADETGAESIVLGAYYADGADLQFHVQIADARGNRVALALDPIRGPRIRPLEGVEAARQRVMASLATLTPGRKGTFTLEDEPPTYAAYEAYVSGEDLFTRGDMRGAIASYERAAAIDSTYVYPLLRSALAHINLGNSATADSILGRVEKVRQRFAPMDQLRLEWLRADLRADWSRAYAAVRRADELAPRTRFSYQRGLEAYRLNRPRETVACLLRVDPHRAWLAGRLPTHYGDLLASAYHVLGEHGNELETARRFRREYPDHMPTLILEVRALVGLGRVAESRTVVDRGLALPRGQATTPGDLLRVWATELRAHGHPAAADSAIERSIAWFRARPPEEAATEATRFGVARSLYQARRWDEAHAAFAALADSFPDTIDYVTHLGALAARREDHAEAERIAARLHAWREPYSHGASQYAEAVVAALRGDREGAVAYLREAFARGYAFNIDFHRNIDLEALRGYRPFEELLGPPPANSLVRKIARLWR